MPALNDLMFDWLGTQGAVGNTLPDRRYEFFKAQGIGTWREYYNNSGGTGHLNDWLYDLMGGGGLQIGTLPPNCLLNCGENAGGTRVGYREGSFGDLNPTDGDTFRVLRLLQTDSGSIRLRAETLGGVPAVPGIFTAMTLSGSTYLEADATFSGGQWQWPVQNTIAVGGFYNVGFS